MRVKVFLTDDANETIETLTMVYNDHPEFEVVGHATNTSGTLEALRTLQIDIISLDIQLGRDNGIELCSKIRAEFPNIFVVMCSIESNYETRIEAEQAGASYFLSKPFGLRELNAMLWAYREFKNPAKDTSQIADGEDEELVNSLRSLLDVE